MNTLRRWLTGRDSLRARLTFIATFSFAVAFGLASVTLVRSVRNSLESGARQDTREALTELVSQLQRGADIDEIRTNEAETVQFQITTPDGAVLAGSTAPGSPLFRVTKRGVVDASSGDVYVEQRVVRVGTRPLTVATASPLATVDASVEQLVEVLRIGTPVLVVLLAIIVWLLVGRALRPVDLMRAQLAEIGGATLDRRVDVGAADAEVVRLADTMNAMLERIETASARQQEFVADASHELRSPTSAIRAELEVALAHPDDAAWPEVASRSLHEAERLSALIDDLLTLARFDETTPTARAQVVDLDELVLDEAERMHRFGLGTEAVSAGRVTGDAARLTQVVRNLVDNAMRHAAGRVAVGVHTEGPRVVLDVDDDGPGVPPAERERIFDRFARLDTGRSRQAGGTGLGLSIVRHVATNHGAEVEVVSREGEGSTFRLIVPARRGGG